MVSETKKRYQAVADQTFTNQSLKLSLSLQVNSATKSTKKVKQNQNKPPHNSASFLVCFYEREMKVLSETS